MLQCTMLQGYLSHYFQDEIAKCRGWTDDNLNPMHMGLNVTTMQDDIAECRDRTQYLMTF